MAKNSLDKLGYSKLNHSLRSLALKLVTVLIILIVQF